MATVKKIKIVDSQGVDVSYDIGALAQNIVYDNNNSVKDKIDDYEDMIPSSASSSNKLLTEEDLSVATDEQVGLVKPDGTTIIIDENGTLTAIGGGGGVTTRDYAYTGTIQTFTAPETGTYTLEVQGGQGGTPLGGVHGGYGGYSVGKIDLNQDDTIYICVGGEGGNSSSDPAAYNGGGLAYFGDMRGNGGGATHIATATGELADLASNQSTVIIVAGGGGGAGNYAGTDQGDGGSGGGYIGGHGLFVGSTTGDENSHTGSGGTQSAGGATENYSVQSTGSFGQGASTDNGDLWGGSGGGGGQYGGGASTNNAGAGGGSGYLNTSILTDACMYGYNVQESSETATKTMSVLAYNSIPTPSMAKAGSGYARISQTRENNISLTDLTDVDISTPQNGQVLGYNSTSGKWENQTKSGGLPETPLSIAHGGTGNTVGYIQTGHAGSTTIGAGATIEGGENEASGEVSHAEGSYNVASGNNSHAEGHKTTASDLFAHAEGYNTTASEDATHAEGNGTTASELYAHAEGHSTTASGEASHAEGASTTASSTGSHAEGVSTTASGNYSHAGGATSVASGNWSFAHGVKVTAGYDAQSVFGNRNNNKSNTLFEVGNGRWDANTGNDVYSNAFEVYRDGKASWDNGSTKFQFTAQNGEKGYIDESGTFNAFGGTTGDVYAGLGVGKMTSFTNNVIDTDIDLHRAPVDGDRLLVYISETVSNPSRIKTYNNGVAVTTNITFGQTYPIGLAIFRYTLLGWDCIQTIAYSAGTGIRITGTTISNSAPQLGMNISYGEVTSVTDGNIGIFNGNADYLDIDFKVNASPYNGGYTLQLATSGSVVIMKYATLKDSYGSAYDKDIQQGTILHCLSKVSGTGTAQDPFVVKVIDENVIANPTGTPDYNLKKVKVGSYIYDALGIKPYEAYSISNGGISIHTADPNTYNGQIIAVSTGMHSGTTTNAWYLVLVGNGSSYPIAMINADGTDFKDALSENELLFVYVDTRNPQKAILLKAAGASGGGASALTDLTDTNITSPTDGQVLIYNGTTGKWENKPKEVYFEQSVTLSTSQTTTVTFTDARILATSVVDPAISVWGIFPEDVTVANGSCTVVMPKVSTAQTITVGIFIKR